MTSFTEKLSLKTPLCPYVTSIKTDTELHKWSKIGKATNLNSYSSCFFLVDMR